MSPTARRRILLTLLTLWAGALLLTGQNWGLPSREADRFLFGDQAPWSAERIQSAGGPWSPSSGAADADTSPLTPATQPTVLNDTPARQAQIIRRYRLFSHQPDEMLTFMALAGMKSHNYDPRMYQYGGLWFYPVGGLLKVASLFGAVTLKPDLNYYLDHPEQFARFYVVARLYSASWGIFGTWVALALARRLFAGRILLATVAAAIFPLLPVVINGAHEAKPHLAGAVLVLLTVLVALKHLETRKWTWALLAGVAAGLATGMVLSSAVALVVLPVMCWIGKGKWMLRLIGVTLIAVFSYCATNPWVAINLLRNPNVVKENLGNLAQAKAISGQSNDLSAGINGLRLIAEAAAWPTAAVAMLALLTALGISIKTRRLSVPAIFLAVPVLLSTIQFFTLAGGKNAEFARFAILPAVALSLASVWLITLIRQPIPQAIAIAELLLVGILFALPYLCAFRSDQTRHAAADVLHRLGGGTLVVHAEPAPYCMPPVDLSKWKIVLASSVDGADVVIYPIDTPGPPGPVPNSPFVRRVIHPAFHWLPARITWADKPFEILIREGRNPPPGR